MKAPFMVQYGSVGVGTLHIMEIPVDIRDLEKSTAIVHHSDLDCNWDNPNKLLFLPIFSPGWLVTKSGKRWPVDNSCVPRDWSVSHVKLQLPSKLHDCK